MKRVLSCAAIFLVIALCFCGCSQEEGFQKPTESFYVNDFADVIDEEDESRILSAAVALNQKTTAQVVTVTVEDLNGYEPSQYALELGREWGVGTKEADNGIVILLSRNDREIYIAVGYGLEGALPDSKTGRIIDLYGLEYLKQDDFSKGLLNIATAIINEVYIEYGLPAENGYVSIENMPITSYETEISGGKVVVSWLGMIVMIAIYIFLYKKFGIGVFFLGSHRGFRGGFGSGGSFRGGGGFSGGGGSFGGGGAGRGF